MTKRLLTFLLAFALLLTMTGCSAAGMARSLDAAEDRVEDKLDALEDQAEHTLRKAVTPTQPAPAQSAPTTASTQPAPEPAETAPAAAAPTEAAPAPAQPSGITRDEAEKIALEHAGFTADQVQYLRSEPDYDHGHKKYDVEFQIDRWEYDYEIHAETGEILSLDKDWDD